MTAWVKWKAAAGDERDLDAARGRVDERVAMRVGQPAPAVEQRAVDVDGEEADHQAGGQVGTARSELEKFANSRNQGHHLS